MKIAAVMFRYFPYGGVQKDFLRIAEEAHRRGHSIELFTMTWEGGRPEWLPMHFIRPHGFSNHARAARFFADLPGVLNHKDFDIVFGMSRGPGLDVCFAADDCFKLTQAKKHSAFLNKYSKRIRTFTELEGAVFAPESQTEILCLTQDQIHQYERTWGTQRKRMHPVPPGMNPECFRQADSTERGQAIRTKLGIPPEKQVIIHVASNLMLKGADRVIQAVSALPEDIRKNTVTLFVGNAASKLKKQAAVSKADIRFAGCVDSVADWLFAADVMVHPARSEAAGSVIIEGIAAGVPVVCTDNCGFCTFVKASGAGCVIPGEDFSQEMLNDALTAVFAYKNTLPDLKKAAADFTGKYNLNGRAGAIVDFLEGRVHAAHRD